MFNGFITNLYLVNANENSKRSVLKCFPKVQNLILYFPNPYEFYIDLASLSSDLFANLDSITVFAESIDVLTILLQLSPLLISKKDRKVVPIWMDDQPSDSQLVNLEDFTWRNQWKLMPPIGVNELLSIYGSAMDQARVT